MILHPSCHRFRHVTHDRHRYALNLRISAVERNLIDQAAAAQGTTRTDCILRAARKAAEEVLLDRALVLVSQNV